MFETLALFPSEFVISTQNYSMMFRGYSVLKKTQASKRASERGFLAFIQLMWASNIGEIGQLSD